MSEKIVKKKLLDDFEWISIGFCAAIRSKDYFLFFKDVFNVMNKIQAELEPGAGSRSDTYFLDQILNSKKVGQNWKKICTLYDRGFAPIRELPREHQRKKLAAAAAPTATLDPIGQGPDLSTAMPGGQAEAPVSSPPQTTAEGSDELPIVQEIDEDGDEETREMLEYKKLVTALHIIFPPPGKPDEDIMRFAKFFLSRRANEVEKDFKSCQQGLEDTCMKLAGYPTPKDKEVEVSEGPKKVLERREERLRLVRNLFAQASANFICSSSEVLKNLLLQGERAQRRLFHAGEGMNTLDGKLGGFNGTGLMTFLGGTSGFKTGVMSSIVANYCLDAFVNQKEAPAVWGYIGEDGVEAYTQRALTNLMNRDPILSEYKLGTFSISQFSERMVKEPEFRDVAFALTDLVMSNCHWIKAPENPLEKLNFSLINILSAFEAKLEAGDVKPQFIIIDYLNLLNLPKGAAASSSNRAQELSTIAHMMDEWAQQKGLTIITAVQASISGAIAARDDLRFFMQEDLHECKSIAHHCRLVISLLPFSEYQDNGSYIRRMAMKVLKNRGGKNGDIFTSSLNEAANITFADSQHWEEAQWMMHKENIISKKAEIMGIKTGLGAGNRGGKGNAGGGFRGGSGPGGFGGGGQRQGPGQGFQGGKQGGGAPRPPSIATTEVARPVKPDNGEI